jgi:hypothetical protein
MELVDRPVFARAGIQAEAATRSVRSRPVRLANAIHLER